MKWHQTTGLTIALAAAIAAILGVPPLSAQTTTFQNYRCADGTQFVVGFFPYDSRAHLQIDGKEATLLKRLALSGNRYSGEGVTLNIANSGIASVKRARRPTTSCELP
jgi:membrane-bound inhibitor of C-type lysozyme